MDPGQQNYNNDSNDQQVAPPAGDQWQTKEEYETAHAAIPVLPVIPEDLSVYNKQIQLAAAGIGFVVMALLVLHITPLGQSLPTIYPTSSRSAPASPVIGFLYLALALLIVYEIIVIAVRSSKRAATGKKLSGKSKTLLAILGGIGLFFFGGPLATAPLFLLLLIICNFSPCAGT